MLPNEANAAHKLKKLTMYKEITHNKLKSITLIGGFLVLVIGLGWVLSYAFNEPIILPIAVVIAVVQAWSGYFWGARIALSIAHAKLAPRQNHYLGLHRIVENLSITAGIPKPKIYIIVDNAPNAFASGRNPEYAVIAVTTGLLEKLSKTELEGVISHELSHIGNYDILVMTIVVVLASVVSLISDFFLRSLWFSGGRNNSDRNSNSQGIIMLIAIVFAILAPIIAILIQLAVSRKREYLADATGSLLTRYPEGLALALEKISSDHHELQHASSATNHLYISNPLKERHSWITNIFSTHPPIEERVKRLRGMIEKP